MDKSIVVDVGAAAGLFLFTGVETGLEGTVMEIISKFGVVAVLWFWLREMKSQMKDQLNLFTDETNSMRNEHKDTMKEFKDVHDEHRQILMQQLKSKDEIIKQLQNKIKE